MPDGRRSSAFADYVIGPAWLTSHVRHERTRGKSYDQKSLNAKEVCCGSAPDSVRDLYICLDSSGVGADCERCGAEACSWCAASVGPMGTHPVFWCGSLLAVAPFHRAPAERVWRLSMLGMPNNRMHTNRRHALQFRWTRFLGRWIRCRRPFPAAVGDLFR